MFLASSYTSASSKTPTRCRILVTAVSDVPGNIDPSPGNNTAEVEINVNTR